MDDSPHGEISAYFLFISLFLVLYRGAFSIVKKCVKKGTGEEFAAKIINTTKLSQKGTYVRR